MLVHRRVTPSTFAGTHLYTWVKRSTVRVKCLASEHNTMTLARTRTRTTRSGVERTNHEATAPPRQREETTRKRPLNLASAKGARLVLKPRWTSRAILPFVFHCIITHDAWAYGPGLVVSRAGKILIFALFADSIVSNTIIRILEKVIQRSVILIWSARK